MSNYVLKNGKVYLDHQFQDKTLLILDGKIRFLEGNEFPEGCECIDLEQKMIVPGMIDIHTHGAVGVDVNSADAEEFAKMGRFFAQGGTTAWLASVLTDSREKTLKVIDQYCSCGVQKNAAELLGLHLEGPFLAKEYKGAMPEAFLRSADLDLIREYQERADGGIRYMTVAPEVSGVLELIPYLRDLGIVVSLGHSGADYETAMRAVRAGAVSSTHTGNAMRPLDRHDPGILGAVLESNEISCEMICDGKHLHPGIVRLYLKTKGPQGLIGITDSIMATGLPGGTYHLGVNEIYVQKEDARLSDGTRAGSTLTQIQALRNVKSFTGRSLEEILPIFTENPAKLIGVYDRKGSITLGKDADLLVLDNEMNVSMVFLRGEML